MPFLTDLDSRARVKGSRDPLGIQQIWTQLGRHVVGNLTTVSNSVREFTTLLLGYYLAEQLSHELGPGTELETFLKWEQLAAYSRALVNEDFDFRGTEKVRKNTSDGPPFFISADRSHQILGNQKIYGLWGLYTVPARASGLLDGDPPRLTPPALELVQDFYLPRLQEALPNAEKHIREVLCSKQYRLTSNKYDSRLTQAVASLFPPKFLAPEREFFEFHLLQGGPLDSTDGRQRQLSELLSETVLDQEFEWSPSIVGHLVKSAQQRGDTWRPLALRLDRIRVCEAVMAPSATLFTYLLGLGDKTISSVEERLEEQWGSGLRSVYPEEFGELRAELSSLDSQSAQRWTNIAESLSTGDYPTLLKLLIAQNSAVMTARGGSPWIESRSGKLDVRFRDELGSLPKRDEVPSLWRFPYFLESLRTVAVTLEES